MTRRHNYQKKIEDLAINGKFTTIPGVYILHIYHDDWCNFLKGGTCNCDPDFVQETPNLKSRENRTRNDAKL